MGSPLEVGIVDIVYVICRCIYTIWCKVLIQIIILFIDAFLESQELIGILIGLVPGVLLGLSSVSSVRYRACSMIGVFKSPCHEFFPGEITELIWNQNREWISRDG